MSHNYHEVLPGFDAAQILHDGCRECEYRSTLPDHGIAHLDVGSFMRAVDRAREWNHRGLPNISEAEMPLLSTLWSVWLQLERRGATSALGATR